MNAFTSHPTHTNSGAFFDVEQFSVLGELSEAGDAEIIAEVVAQFLEDVNTTLKRLEESIAQGKFQLASDLGHTLKGSFATFGMMRAHALARQIEHEAHECRPESLPTLYRSMLGCFMAGRNALQAHMNDYRLAVA